jgi:hypothetical protein
MMAEQRESRRASRSAAETAEAQTSDRAEVGVGHFGRIELAPQADAGVHKNLKASLNVGRVSGGGLTTLYPLAICLCGWRQCHSQT